MKPSIESFMETMFNHRWLTSVTFVALFAALCYGLVGIPYYETNDDVTMTAIVSGAAFLDRPDEHIPWSSVCLGLLLKQLYSALPTVPWYGIVQISAVFISITVITWLLIGKSSRPIMMSAIAASVLLITCTRPILVMQFTTSGAVAACAGVLLMMESVERWHLRKKAVACAIGAALLVVVSCMFRSNSAYVVLIVTAMFVVSRFSSSPLRQLRKMLTHLLALSTAFAIVFTCTSLSEAYYSGEWKDFHKVIRATAQIREYRLDQPDSPLRSSMYQQVGWTPTDSTLFQNWYGLDKNIYSLEKLTTLATLIEKEHLVKTFDSARAVLTAQTLLFDPMFTILILPVLCLVPFLNRAKVPLLSTVLLSIGVIALCAFFILYMKLPVRVLGAIIMPLALFSLRYSSTSKVASIFSRSAAGQTVFARTVYGTSLLVALAPSFWLLSLEQTRKESMARLENRNQLALRNLSPQPNQLYVCWAANPRIIVTPFTDLRKTFHNFNTIPVGAIGAAPFVMKRLKDAGIKDLLADLDREDIFLISNDQYNRFIRMYAAEKLGKEVVFTKLPVKPKIFECFKVKYIEPADPDKLKQDLSVAFLYTEQPDSQRKFKPTDIPVIEILPVG